MYLISRSYNMSNFSMSLKNNLHLTPRYGASRSGMGVHGCCTLGGKRYPQTSVCMSSQVPVIGWRPIIERGDSVRNPLANFALLSSHPHMALLFRIRTHNLQMMGQTFLLSHSGADRVLFVFALFWTFYCETD